MGSESEPQPTDGPRAQVGMNTLRTIFEDFRSHWWLVAVGLTAILGLELLSLYGPQLIKQGIDMLASGQGDGRRLLRLAGKMSALALSVAALRVLSRPFLLAFGRLVERDVRKNLFSHIAGLPAVTMQRHPAGEVMARATYDIDNIRLAAGYGFQAAVSSLLTLLLALAYMIHMSPLLTLPAAVPMVAIPRLTRRQSIKFHNCHQNIQKSFASLTEESRDSLNAIRLIKVYDLMDIKSLHFRRMAESHRERNMELARVSALYLPVMTLVTHLSQAVVWGLGGSMAVLGLLTAGDVVAFSAYLVMLKSPLVYSGYLINLGQRARSSRRRVDEIFGKPVEDAGCPAGSTMESCASEDILVRNLTFTYPGESRPVLKDISLKIPGRTTSAIVGPVGSGKSTLLKLLTRIYEPPEETIFIGGRDITRIPLKGLRSLMSMTAQEPFVFSGSVRENLLLACPEATEGELWQVIDDAGLKAEIRALPAMLDTLLGERGHTLSGGQKARLSFARTLLQQRRFLLLDDPLSAVDTRAEAFILSNLTRLRNGRTNLIISHRPLSLAFSENIFVLDQGRLKEQGAHRALLARGGLYHRLVLTQQLTHKVRGPDGRP
jgi:ATP-binding cassette, subfamily B, multidrug efflux pump